MKAALQEATALVQASGEGSGYGDLFKPPIKKRVFIAIGLQVLQQGSFHLYIRSNLCHL
eukprot:SAG31_NODE_5571_length_2450_cov_1.577201_1_plen_59_part_00